MVYLDHAATTPVRSEALRAMLPYFQDSFANASSHYAEARKARKAVDTARLQMAEALHANVNEIYITSGGSESDNWAIMGVTSACPEKKHIVTTRIEHHAVLHPCEALEKRGYEVTYLDVDEQGRVSPEALKRALRPDTLLVSVMLANNEVGTIEPIAELSAITHKCGAWFHTDAVQAVGHIPVDVLELGVDLLSLSAHKFGGPKGIGALYIKNGVRIDPLIYGGSQERGIRAGTENVPAVVGMATALALATQELEQSVLKTQELRDALERELLNITGLHVNGDREHRLPGHLHVTIDDANTDALLMRLDMAGIAVSAGSACSSGSLEQSHVLSAMGITGERQANLRFSIGRENTLEQMIHVSGTLRHILNRV